VTATDPRHGPPGRLTLVRTHGLTRLPTPEGSEGSQGHPGAGPDRGRSALASRPRSLELFTGGGGLAEAMRAAGFEHLLVNDLDERACETLRLNRAREGGPGDGPGAGTGAGWPLTAGDIRSVDFRDLAGRVDVVAGGVPCQPWSLGGGGGGDEDSRNLWPEFVRAVRETAPRVFLAENARSLLRPGLSAYWEYTLRTLTLPYLVKREGEPWPEHDGRLRRELRSAGLTGFAGLTGSSGLTGSPGSPSSAGSVGLAGLGGLGGLADLPGPVASGPRYRVSVHLVNAADYGVPGIRRRVFTIGVRDDLGAAVAWPAPTHSEAALALDQRDGGYWERHRLRARPPVIDGPGEGDPAAASWRTIRDALRGLPEPRGHQEEYPGWLHHAGWEGTRTYPGHTPNVLDLPAKTISAGAYGMPGGESVLRLDDGSIRHLTVREVARIMTFPDDWRLAGSRDEQMRQLADAVPVRLGLVAAQAVAALLRPRVRPA